MVKLANLIKLQQQKLQVTQQEEKKDENQGTAYSGGVGAGDSAGQAGQTGQAGDSGAADSAAQRVDDSVPVAAESGADNVQSGVGERVDSESDQEGSRVVSGGPSERRPGDGQDSSSDSAGSDRRNETNTEGRSESQPAPDASGSGNSGTGSRPKPSLNLAGLKLKAATQAKHSPQAPAKSASRPASPVDSLEAIASDESTGLATLPATSFSDEIPATAPIRDLPDDLSESMLAFVKTLDGIYEVASDPELFGQMIKHIMMELRENPQYKKLLADDDVATMIRGMRESMGLARIKKEASKAKRSGSTSKSRKSSVKNDDMLDDLAALAASSGMTFD